MSRRLAFIAPVALALLAGCGTTTTSSRPQEQHVAKAPASLVRFMHVDAADRAVDLTLIAGDGAANNGFNFDGYGRGELLVRVPSGWRVTVHCRNAGPGFNSCAVVSGRVKLAFPGASTPQPATGLAPGAASSFTFTPTRTGTYRLASVVPGHEQARMYAVLEVTNGGQPAIHARS